MSCDHIREALRGFDRCVETPDGSRVPTHCVYPSFERVSVFVAKVGDGFKVHDSGGAFRAAWAHGRDEGLIVRAINTEARRFGLEVVGQSLVADVQSQEWLTSAIITVANASSFAANAAVSRIVKAAEEALVDKMETQLTEAFGRSAVSRDVEVLGRSGGKRRFDFALRSGDTSILINGVAPHGGSIASKYVSFADADGLASQKIATFDRELDTDDVALLQQVATIVPLRSLAMGASRALHVPWAG